MSLTATKMFTRFFGICLRIYFSWENKVADVDAHIITKQELLILKKNLKATDWHIARYLLNNSHLECYQN